MSTAQKSTAQDYLNAAIAAPAEQKGSDFGFETIAKIKTDFGLHCFIGSDYSLNKFFPYPDMEDKTRQEILKVAKFYIKEVGGSRDFPSPTIQIIIFGSEVLTAKDGSWANDWVEAVGSYGSKTNVYSENAPGVSPELWGKPKAFKNLDPEVRERLEGQNLLYDIITDSLTATEAQTFLKPMWARIKEVIDPIVYAQDKRERAYTDKNGEEKMTFKTRRVKIMEVYPDKATAQIAADGILVGFSNAANNPLVDSSRETTLSRPGLTLSATAMTANWTLEGLQKEAENLHGLVAGRPLEVVNDVLKKWSLERSDLKLVNIEIPF